MAFILVLIQLFTSQPAQQLLFPVDDYGKYTFQEVVEVPGINKEKLFENGQTFVKKIKVMDSKKKFFSVDDSAFVLTNKGSFYVYQYGSVNKAIDGAVEYDITIEVKDNKYRYTITNFIFNEYKRNRYGKFEPVSGKSMPLEADVSGMNKKGWKKNRQVVYDKTQELIQNLYGEMIYTEKKATKKVKKENNW